ncbi:hypothetical protein DSO57_1012393 [Entomophthora muscae]|uniref:Uncharacterized protein n=1 Tax=Entomophthora muscae TaxID=34485 RepID=A0ACC2UFH9_9FUNG|nr:hypothetical protein DSO57_1012393 [Entomophthora muscae]
MSYKRKCDFDNDYLAKDDLHGSNKFNGHKFSQSTTLNTRGSRPSSRGSARSRISQESSIDTKFTHPISSSFSKKTNKSSTTLRQKVLLKETYEFWVYEDLCFRNSLPNLIIGEGSDFPSESSRAASLLSAGSETSISCYTNSSDCFSINGLRLYPTFTDEEYSLISSGKYKPLFEKLVFSIHSKNRVEAIKNFLSKIRISRRQEYLSAKQEETSPFLSLRDRIQDLKIKVKYHTRLQREQQVSVQKLKSSISQLIERKSSLSSAINQTKKRITLKDLFAEKSQSKLFPKTR